MKIFMLCTSYPRFSKDYWVPFTHALAKELAKENDVSVIASHSEDTKNFDIIDNVKVYRFQYFWPKRLQRLTYTGGMFESYRASYLAKIQAPFFFASFFFKSLKHCRKADVINAHWTLSGLVALLVTKFYKKPIVLTLHGGGMRYLPKFVNKYVLNRVDAIVTAHHDLTEIAKKMAPKKETFNVRNMIDFDKFNKKVNVRDVKKRFGIENENVVSFVGRLVDLKDPLTFVKAIPHVLKKRKDIKFMIVGGGHMEQSVKELVEKLNVKDHSLVTGPLSEVNEVFSISDIYCAIDVEENFITTTIVEAMMMKTPCIITDAGHTSQYFTHKKDSYIIPISDEEKLAEAILYLLENKSLRMKLGVNGHNFIKSMGFMREDIVKAYMEVFSKSLS